MISAVVFEMPSSDEGGAAEAVLRTMGYGVRRTSGDPRRLHVRVRPGEKPQAALREIGITFRLRAARV